MPRRVLILDTGKEWGGGTESLLELLKRVDRSRYEFTALFSHNYRKGAGSDVRTEIERLGLRFIQLERPRWSLYSKAIKEAGRAALFFSLDLKKKFVFSRDYAERILPEAKRISEVLKTGGFDLLYMNNQPSSNLEGILAAGQAGVPSIQHSRVEVRLNPVEAEAVNSHVSRVICVSKGVMDALIESGVRSEKCVVVYNGIDPGLKPGRGGGGGGGGRGEINAGGSALVIGTVGSLIKRKRVELLLEAASMLKGIVRKCVIVGEGPLMEALRKAASSLGIEDTAVFTGFADDALSYIDAMDIFILPSLKEGLPRVVLEAMLMGKPVVAFNVTGPSELIVDGESGVILKEESAEAIATAVVKLLAQKGLIRSMGEAGRRRVVENFSIDRYVKGVERVFEEVLSCST